MLISLLLSSFLTLVELNCENLFDTRHDEGKEDTEFLPEGERHWTPTKYWGKVNRIGQEILSCSDDLPDLVALVEVENDSVLKDLTHRSLLRNAGYQYLMTESNDVRGLDIAFLYQPFRFRPLCYETIQVPLLKNMRSTRDILYVQGLCVSGDTLHVFVVHSPSRYGGELRSRPTRDSAAMLTLSICDSIYKKEPRAKIIIMGDLNDDPYNHSCAEVLKARKTREEVEPQGFFNTLWLKLDRGIGSLAYNGSWNLFDQIIISEPLMNEKLENGNWTYWKSQIFNKDFLTIQDGKDKGTPLRTHKGGVWLDGYGDHYPTMIYLIKEKK